MRIALGQGRRRALAALASIVAVTLLVATLVSGLRYFACAPMQESAWSPCCPEEERARVSHDTPAIEADDDCCRARQFARAADAVSPPAPPVLAAPLVAIVAPIVLAAPERAPRAIVRGRLAARAGPPDSRAYRTRLMVSLT